MRRNKGKAPLIKSLRFLSLCLRGRKHEEREGNGRERADCAAAANRKDLKLSNLPTTIQRCRGNLSVQGRADRNESNAPTFTGNPRWTPHSAHVFVPIREERQKKERSCVGTGKERLIEKMRNVNSSSTRSLDNSIGKSSEEETNIFLRALDTSCLLYGTVLLRRERNPRLARTTSE